MLYACISPCVWCVCAFRSAPQVCPCVSVCVRMRWDAIRFSAGLWLSRGHLKQQEWQECGNRSTIRSHRHHSISSSLWDAEPARTETCRGYLRFGVFPQFYCHKRLQSSLYLNINLSALWVKRANEFPRLLKVFVPPYPQGPSQVFIDNHSMPQWKQWVGSSTFVLWW